MLYALISLAVSGFLSSTVLPGSSEAVFLAFLLHYPEYLIVALWVVTVANTAGSMTSFLLTRFIPHKQPTKKALDMIGRFGTPLLFFSFTPIVGDMLPLAAGLLRLSVLKSLLFIMLGKFVRYGALAWIALKLS